MATTFCKAIDQYSKLMSKDLGDLKILFSSPEFVYVKGDTDTQFDKMLEDFLRKKKKIKGLTDEDALQIADFIKAKKAQSKLLQLSKSLKGEARNKFHKAKINESVLEDFSDFAFSVSKASGADMEKDILGALKRTEDQFQAGMELKFDTISSMYDDVLDRQGLPKGGKIDLNRGAKKDSKKEPNLVSKADLLSKFVDADTVVKWKDKSDAFIRLYDTTISGGSGNVYESLFAGDILKGTGTRFDVRSLVKKYLKEMEGGVTKKRLVQIQDEIVSAVRPVVDQLDAKTITDIVEANRKLAQAKMFMKQAGYKKTRPLKYQNGKTATNVAKVPNEGVSNSLQEQYIKDFLKEPNMGRLVDNITEDQVRMWGETEAIGNKDLTGAVQVKKVSIDIFEIGYVRKDGGLNIVHIDIRDSHKIKQSLNFTSRQAFLDPFAKNGLGFSTGNPIEKNQEIFVENYLSFMDTLTTEEVELLGEKMRGNTGQFRASQSSFIASLAEPMYKSNFGVRGPVAKVLLRNNDFLKSFAPKAHDRISRLSAHFARLKNDFDHNIMNYFQFNDHKLVKFEEAYDNDNIGELMQIISFSNKMNKKDIFGAKLTGDNIHAIWAAYRKDGNLIAALRGEGFKSEYNDGTILGVFNDVVKTMARHRKREVKSFRASTSFVYNNFRKRDARNTEIFPNLPDISTVVKETLEGYVSAYWDMYKKADKITETKKGEVLTKDMLREEIVDSYLKSGNNADIKTFNIDAYNNLNLMRKLDIKVYGDPNKFKKLILNNKNVSEKQADRIFEDYMGEPIGYAFSRWFRSNVYQFKLNIFTPNGRVLAAQDLLTNINMNHSAGNFYKKQSKSFSKLTTKLNRLEEFSKSIGVTSKVHSAYNVNPQKAVIESEGRQKYQLSQLADFAGNQVADLWEYGVKKVSGSDVVMLPWVQRKKGYREAYVQISKKLEELGLSGVKDLSEAKIAIKKSADFDEIKKLFDDAGGAHIEFDSFLQLKRAGETSRMSPEEISAMLSSPQNRVPFMMRKMGLENNVFNRALETTGMNIQGMNDIADEIMRLKESIKDTKASIRKLKKGNDVDKAKGLELERALIREKGDKDRLVSYVEDKMGAVQKEAEEIYMRQTNTSVLVGDNRNYMSRFWYANFFSGWGSKMVGNYLHHGLFDIMRKFHETYVNYGMGPASKEMTANMVNNPQLRSIIWNTKLYMKAKMNMEKDNDFEAYEPESTYENALQHLSTSPLFAAINSFFVTRAIGEGINKYDGTLGLGYTKEQAIGKSMNAFLYGLSSNVMREFKQLGRTPVSNFFNVLEENKNVSASDLTDIMVDYFATSFVTYSAYSMGDVYKGAKFDRLDQEQLYPMIDMLLGANVTKYRGETSALIDDSYDLKTLKDNKEGGVLAFLDIVGLGNQMISVPEYYSTKLKLGQYKRVIDDDPEIQAIKGGDFSGLSDEVMSYLTKNLDKHTWSGLYKDGKESNDEQGQLGFVLADVESKGFNPSAIINVFKNGDLTGKKRKLAELEVAGMSKYSIMMLMRSAMQEETSSFRSQYKKQTGNNLPEEVTAKLENQFMRKNVDVMAEIDKNFHRTIVEGVIREKHGGNVAGIKELGSGGKGSAAFRLFSMGLLTELVDLDKIGFDRRNVNNVFSSIFEDVPDSEKVRTIIEAHEVIDNLPGVSEYGKESTKAAMLFSEMRNLKTFLTDPKGYKLSDDIRKMSEIIIDMDHRTDMNPAYLANLLGANARGTGGSKGKKTTGDLSGFPSQVKDSLKSLRQDMMKVPEIRSGLLKYITSPRAQLGMKAIFETGNLFSELNPDDGRQNFFEPSEAPKQGAVQKSDIKLTTGRSKSGRKPKRTKRARKLKIKKVGGK